MFARAESTFVFQFTAPFLLWFWTTSLLVIRVVAWTIVLGQAVIASLWHVRLMPVLFIGIYVVSLPLAPAQQPVIDFLEMIGDAVDNFYNAGVRLLIHELIFCGEPLCQILSLVIALLFDLLNLFVDPIRFFIPPFGGKRWDDDLLKSAERYAATMRQTIGKNPRAGFDSRDLGDEDDEPPVLAITEIICGTIEIVLEFLLDLTDVILSAIFQLIGFLLEVVFTGGANVSSFGHFLTVIFVQILGIDCLDFSDFEAFIASILDCIGLDCMLCDEETPPPDKRLCSFPEEFVENFLVNCLQIPEEFAACVANPFVCVTQAFDCPEVGEDLNVGNLPAAFGDFFTEFIPCVAEFLIDEIKDLIEDFIEDIIEDIFNLRRRRTDPKGEPPLMLRGKSNDTSTANSTWWEREEIGQWIAPHERYGMWDSDPLPLPKDDNTTYMIEELPNGNTRLIVYHRVGQTHALQKIVEYMARRDDVRTAALVRLVKIVATASKTGDGQKLTPEQKQLLRVHWVKKTVFNSINSRLDHKMLNRLGKGFVRLATELRKNVTEKLNNQEKNHVLNYTIYISHIEQSDPVAIEHYRQLREEGYSDPQIMWKSILNIWDNYALILTETMHWNPLAYTIIVPSNAQLYTMSRRLGNQKETNILSQASYNYMRDRWALNRTARNPFLTQLETSLKLSVVRILMPDRLQEKAEALRSRGSNYIWAVDRTLDALKDVSPMFDRLTAVLNLKNLEAEIDEYLKTKVEEEEEEDVVIDESMSDILSSMQGGFSYHPNTTYWVPPSDLRYVYNFRETKETETVRSISMTTIISIASVILKYGPRIIVSGLITFASTPVGSAIIRQWIFFVLKIFDKYFTEPLNFALTDDDDDHFDDFEDISIGFVRLIGAQLGLIANHVTRFGLCNLYPQLLNLVFGWVLYPIYFFFQPFLIPLYPFALYCPPLPLVDSDGLPVQFWWDYLFAIMDCFKDDPDTLLNNAKCTTKSDCPGGAPCRCAPGVDFESFLFSISGDQVCPGDSGRCMCWPQFPCDFRLPKMAIGENFAGDCEQDFGYKLTGLIKFPWPISWFTDPRTFFKIAFAAVTNSIVGIKWVTRVLAKGFLIPWLATLIPALFIITGQWRSGLIMGFVIIGWNVGIPIITAFIRSTVVPFLLALEKLSFPINLIAGWILDFLRFPNFTLTDPLGDKRAGELICFVANLPTLFGGIGIAWIFVLIVFWIVALGIALGTLLYLLELISIPIKMYSAARVYMATRRELDIIHDGQQRNEEEIRDIWDAMDTGGGSGGLSERRRTEEKKYE